MNFNCQQCGSCSEDLKTSWRQRRLLLELKALQHDPPTGINAKPLDGSFYFWQGNVNILHYKFGCLTEVERHTKGNPKKYSNATCSTRTIFFKAAITGPAKSPYEGGLFYLFLQIPPSYPLKPPVRIIGYVE